MPGRLEVIGMFSPPAPTEETMLAAGYGAVFAVVGVDARHGPVQIRHMLGVYDAGRIINPAWPEPCDRVHVRRHR